MAASRKLYKAVAAVLAGEAAMAKAMHNTEDPGVWPNDKGTLSSYSKSVAAMTTVKNIMHSLADVFAQDNELFNRELFYKACGFTPN